MAEDTVEAITAVEADTMAAGTVEDLTVDIEAELRSAEVEDIAAADTEVAEQFAVEVASTEVAAHAAAAHTVADAGKSSR
jgi:hypothetical protein